MGIFNQGEGSTRSRKPNFPARNIIIIMYGIGYFRWVLVSRSGMLEPLMKLQSLSNVMGQQLSYYQLQKKCMHIFYVCVHSCAYTQFRKIGAAWAIPAAPCVTALVLSSNPAKKINFVLHPQLINNSLQKYQKIHHNFYINCMKLSITCLLYVLTYMYLTQCSKLSNHTV